MQRVTITWKDKTTTVIPIANLENTTRLLEGKIESIDYGTAPVATTAVSTSKPDLTWKKKKLLKYARSKDVEVQDNDTKAMILKAIGDV